MLAEINFLYAFLHWVQGFPNYTVGAQVHRSRLANRFPICQRMLSIVGKKTCEKFVRGPSCLSSYNIYVL